MGPKSGRKKEIKGLSIILIETKQNKISKIEYN
jgi:hypothetical protein